MYDVGVADGRAFTAPGVGLFEMDVFLGEHCALDSVSVVVPGSCSAVGSDYVTPSTIEVWAGTTLAELELVISADLPRVRTPTVLLYTADHSGTLHGNGGAVALRRMHRVLRLRVYTDEEAVGGAPAQSRPRMQFGRFSLVGRPHAKYSHGEIGAGVPDVIVPLERYIATETIAATQAVLGAAGYHGNGQPPRLPPSANWVRHTQGAWLPSAALTMACRSRVYASHGQDKHGIATYPFADLLEEPKSHHAVGYSPSPKCLLFPAVGLGRWLPWRPACTSTNSSIKGVANTNGSVPDSVTFTVCMPCSNGQDRVRVTRGVVLTVRRCLDAGNDATDDGGLATERT